MKKLILLLISAACCLSLLCAPIQAKENRQIVVHIKDSEYFYMIELGNQTMKVKSVANSLYTSISCLDNEKTTLKSVDFTKSNTCLLNTLEQSLNTKIDQYVMLDMPLILKAVGLPTNAYDYKTLDSLTSLSNKILDKFKASMLIHYQDYIDTNLSLADLYDLYRFFKKDSFTTKYYHLNYFINKDKYILLDTTFHLQKRL